MPIESSAYAICLLARRRAGLSQRQLAGASGVSPSTIARIEKGRMEPTLALLTRIVTTCGLELRLSLVDAPPEAPAPVLSVEDRLRENDRLSALFLAGEAQRRGL